MMRGRSFLSVNMQIPTHRSFALSCTARDTVAAIARSFGAGSDTETEMVFRDRLPDYGCAARPDNARTVEAICKDRFRKVVPGP